MSATIFTIKRSEIEGRLDPFFYRPDFMQLENAIKKTGALPLRNYVRRIASGATPKTDECEKYYSDKQNGIPFLRVQNLSPTSILNYEDCKYINKETHENMLYRSQVNEGDLLVKITGVGRMAIASVAPKDFVGNTNQHMCVIKTDDERTSWILASWLNTDIAEKLASRRATGGTRPALDYPALLSIPVIFDERIYETMKNAVSKMKIKQQQAKQLLDSIDSYLLSELGITLPQKDNSLSKRIFTTRFSEVSGGRWDAYYNNQYYSDFDIQIESTNFSKDVLKNICSYTSGVVYSSSDERNIGKTILRANNINLETNEVDLKDIKYIDSNIELDDSMKLRSNDIFICTASGSKEHAGKVAFIEDDTDLYFGGFMGVLRVFNKNVHPRYLFEYLASCIFRTHLFRNLGGTNINNINFTMLSPLKIPLPPLPKQKEIASHIREIREQAKQLQVEAEQTMQEAKKQIEKMILGE